MKRILKFFPAVTLFLGIVGATLRLVLFSSVDERGLIPTGLPAEAILNLVSLGLLLCLTALTFFRKNREFQFLLPVPIQAVGCFAAAAACLVTFFLAEETVFIFSLFRILAAVCFLLLAVYRLRAKKPPLLFFALASLSLMVLCFSQYRTWGQNTQLQAYLFPALSALFTAMYSIDFAYMETRERCYKRTFFLNQAALYCNAVCLFSGDWFYYLAMTLWLLSGLFTMPYAMALPGDVKKCITMLEKEGYTAYAVGGCVRDAFMGLEPHDYDLCTSAAPEEICEVFRKYKLLRNGEKHGTIGVIMEDTVYEITTYRTESGYADNRHPDTVEFVDRIEEDLSRRDFTINAMAYHPKSGYFDPYGGQKDIMDCTLRTVGDPETRFREDALRILRGVRFACRFRLNVERDTMKAMKKLSDLQDKLARERVYSELTQILCHVQGDDLKQFAPIITQIIPELEQTINFRQHSVHHAYDVFTHTQKVVTATEPHPALRWAALLHDIGKPQTFQKDEDGQGHFHGHAQASAQMAETILTRLKASTALREQVVFLITHHMDTVTADPALLKKKVSKWGYDSVKRLVQLQMADEAGKGKKKPGTAQYEKIFQALEAIQKNNTCLQIRDLAIDGHDLMEHGFPEGPALGQCQKWLLEQVLSGEIPNEKDVLLERAEEYLAERKDRP